MNLNGSNFVIILRINTFIFNYFCQYKHDAYILKLLTMKITNHIVAFAAAVTLFVGCKDTGNQSTSGNNDVKSEKKAVAAKNPETASFKIDGMTCAIGCAKTIQEKLSKMDGVQKAAVDFDKKQANIDFDASIVAPEKLVKAVESTGDGETYKVSNLTTKKKA